MTLTDLAKTATGTQNEPITLSPDDARDIVSAAADADERCHALAARIDELTRTVAERDATIARLRADAEDTRRQLAAALGITGAAA